MLDFDLFIPSAHFPILGQMTRAVSRESATDTPPPRPDSLPRSRAHSDFRFLHFCQSVVREVISFARTAISSFEVCTELGIQLAVAHRLLTFAVQVFPGLTDKIPLLRWFKKSTRDSQLKSPVDWRLNLPAPKDIKTGFKGKLPSTDVRP